MGSAEKCFQRRGLGAGAASHQRNHVYGGSIRRICAGVRGNSGSGAGDDEQGGADAVQSGTYRFKRRYQLLPLTAAGHHYYRDAAGGKSAGGQILRLQRLHHFSGGELRAAFCKACGEQPVRA